MIRWKYLPAAGLALGALAIAPAIDGFGGTWNADGVILFAPGNTGFLGNARVSH